jgi:hypothetical protein
MPSRSSAFRERVRAVGAWLRRHWLALAAVAAAVLLLAAGGFAWYFSDPLHAREGAVESVRADEDVSLSKANGTYVLEPADGGNADGERVEDGDDDERVGLVFYPGGRVHPDAYLAALAPLAADANVTVFVPQPTLNLAVLDRGMAGGVMARHPEIDRWYVGGHSLGGAMACRYANANPERVAGLVLFASYCDRDVSDSGLRVLSVTGSADAVLDRQRYENTLSNLPADATVVELDGVNHSQFGAYVGQRGGQPSPITFATAHDRLASVVVPWFQRAEPVGGRPAGNASDPNRVPQGF